jgi:MFS superfamily sulfate permease-like transporter
MSRSFLSHRIVNWGRPVRITRADVSGAFADLGLLIPLEASLIAVNGLNPTSTLLGVGVMYVAAGWYFRIPMPVQPLKALAAIAIAQQLDADVIAAGAILMTLSLAALAVTGAIDRLYAIVPTAVIRGIQLGLAYILIKGAITMLGRPVTPGGSPVMLQLDSVSFPLMLALAPVVVLALLLLIKRPVVPASVAVLAVGAVVGLLAGTGELYGLRPGPEPIVFGLPGANDFALAATVLLAAQLPLTIANSVISTADASAAYFPDRAQRVTPRRLSFSIAAGNVWAGLFGGLPVCHGSGGLTAHYSFGARRPLSTALTGLTLIAVALLFGQAGLAFRHIIPLPFFGLLLLFVGLQHAKLALNLPSRSDVPYVALAGALAVVFDGNLAYAGAITLAAYWLVHGYEWLWPRLAPAVLRLP